MAATLVAILAALAVFIARSQAESRSQLVDNFRLRGSASATLVATYIGQQAERQKATAEQLLSTPVVPQQRFAVVAAAFGTADAALLDAAGRVLDVVPFNRRLVGRPLFNAIPAAREAERGSLTVSGVLPVGAGLERIAAVGVPYETTIVGRRVFAAAYRVGGAQLEAFVEHAVAYPQHQVLLLDSRGQLLAASPTTTASSIWGANLPLAEAASHGASGSVPGARVPSTFVAADVKGTPWRIVLMVPDSKLFATIAGTAELIAWSVFGLVALLGLLLVGLFTRSLADRARLSLLSTELESIARTDPLTGLMNRRGVGETLTRAFARARRRGEPVSILMIDLDRFKQINDRYGHEAGDRVLCAVADCLRDVMRSEDIYGRLGGDEFVVAVIEAGEPAARVVAERLAAAAAAVDLSEIGLSEGVPMSVGAATGLHATPDELMRAADAELYRVKGARRAGAPPSAPAPSPR
jgi:diguanylate cyclase (GGDEF)-like protein